MKLLPISLILSTCHARVIYQTPATRSKRQVVTPNIYMQPSYTGVSQGTYVSGQNGQFTTNTGRNINAAGIPINTGGTSTGFNTGTLQGSTGKTYGALGTGVSTGSTFGSMGNGQYGVKKGPSITVFGQEVAQTGSQKSAGPQFGALPPNSPYGPISAGGGWSNINGTTVLGSGFTKGKDISAGWPQGVTRNRNRWDVPIFGYPIAQHRDGWSVKPDTISQWDYANYKGTQAVGTGYQEGKDATFGINGYRWGGRKQVPVLGTNVVDKFSGSGFDVSRMTYSKGKNAKYGPVNINDGKSIGVPWAGDLVQRAVWNKVLKKSGYSGIPGKVVPGPIPNLPLGIGK